MTTVGMTLASIALSVSCELFIVMVSTELRVFCALGQFIGAVISNDIRVAWIPRVYELWMCFIYRQR